MTYDLESHIEELRRELRNADPAERAQIQAELEQVRANLAEIIAAECADRTGEPPH